MAEIFLVAAENEFFQKPVFWFKENADFIKEAALKSLWWQSRILFLFEDQKISPDFLAKKLFELNYERSDFISQKGQFQRRGGFFTIYPVNFDSLITVEFSGNKISSIKESSPRAIKEKVKLPQKEQFFKFGDYLVHQDHGIGMFRGLIQEKKQLYYELEYAKPPHQGMADRLLVPLSQAKKLSLYLGFETPKISRLGSNFWNLTKRKVKESIENIARELLSIYQKRVVASRPPLYNDNVIEKEIETSFEFSPTKDQEKAINEVLSDFESTDPFERIVCGDVGFGKTEVALRALGRVIANGQQVAFIAPTTILALQHFYNFQRRLEKFAIKVGLFTRFEKKEIKKSLDDLKNGQIDLAVGTHRLLSKDIQFKTLRLLIVDEEQRFGVRQKEILKNIKPDIDILYLSATPIPRTLYLALSNLKKLSLIETPPLERKSIKTFVRPFSLKTIKNAIEKEIKRNGQVFYLYNRIQTIQKTQENLQKLFPDLKIEYLHAKLPEKQIIKTMNDFCRGKIKILIATTIIENGLDLKNVNTLIVQNASLLGLAEAHQLRGRIGRGEKQAYAYFFYSFKHLTSEARKRLEILEHYQNLGEGYQIALKDLELRGAGNILGREQSGAINLVGLNLYMQMLNEAIEKQRTIPVFLDTKTYD